MVASIFTYRFYDFDKGKIKIGGIETYTLDLALLLIKLGYETTVYTALNDCDNLRECTYKGFQIKEVYKGSSFDSCFQSLYSRLKGQGLYIVMTEALNINSFQKSNVITIQHGVSWDNPRWSFSKKFQNGLLFTLRKFHINYLKLERFRKVSNIVCVDYNYFNWVCTLHEIPSHMNFSVIPNYASQGISNLDFQRKIDNICDLKKSKIIFARRFTRYRGAQLFANVVKRLLLKYPELDFTFAGDGELEGILKKEFEHSPNVHFTKYSADQSIDFHKDYDIAVVPTIYSEGTSLSLCEAMAAGCLPIATHVGGITNLIIDSFNGMLCYPNENHLLETIEKVINKDVNSYKDLLKNAYQTYVKALNKEKWEERWIAYINTLGK